MVEQDGNVAAKGIQDVKRRSGAGTCRGPELGLEYRQGDLEIETDP